MNEQTGKRYWYVCPHCKKDMVAIGLQPKTLENNLGVFCYNPECSSFGSRLTRVPLEISREMVPLTQEEYEAEKKRRESLAP